MLRAIPSSKFAYGLLLGSAASGSYVISSVKG